MPKKNKNIIPVVTPAYSPVLAGTADSDSNNLSWLFGTIPNGNIIKWSMLNRRYTSPSGHTATYNGEAWLIIQSVYQENWYNAGQSYVLSYEETTARPFDTVDLPFGTYEYNLRGSYGQIGTSLYDKPFVSNTITIVVS